MAPDSDADLRARVAELEQTVAQQQETIQSLLPGRRSVLKGAALLGGGALVGAGTADRASAQASGQVGTSSDPVDVEAHDLAVQNQLSSNVDAGGNDLTNVGSLNTADIQGTGRPYARPGDLGAINTSTTAVTSDNATGTLIDVTDGPGVLIGGAVSGYNILGTNITIDGGSTITISELGAKDRFGDNYEVTPLPNLRYESSLKVTIDTGNGTTRVAGIAYTL